MMRPDPNLAMVELIAQALGPLREQLVFVGGCAAGLPLTDPAAGLARVTYDVDLLAEVTALPEQSGFMDALPGLIFPDESHAERLAILIRRLQHIAASR